MKRIHAVAGMMALSLAAPLRAQTPTHIYDMNDATDANAGPSLVTYGGSFGGGFYTFGANQGLSLSGALTSLDTYSIEMVFRFNSYANGYKKTIDYKALSSDVGSYILGDNDNLYPPATGLDVPTSGLFHLVVTRNGNTSQFNSYINGVQSISYSDNANNYTVFSANDVYFFIDDVQTESEAASGCVSSIRLYDDALTSGQATDRYNATAGMAGVDCPSNQGGGGGGTVVTPEPVTMTLVATGMAGVAAARRRRQSTKTA